MASFEGNVAAARYLLSVDADPNSAHTASGFNTPLHEAARSGSLAVTRLLLKSSANVLAVNSHGDHPLHVACREGRLDIARRLLAHDSDWTTVTARNHAGLRPSEVVSGCWALTSLLGQLEVSSAANAAKANNATNAYTVGADAAADASSGLLAGTAGRRLVSGGRGGRGALRRPGVRKGNKTGMATGVSPSSSQHSAAMALLSGSILPRWARLARPVDEGLHRRGPLDGSDRRRHHHHRQRQQREGVGGPGGGGGVNNVGSIVSEGSEAQSAASCSGTSYGASLTESDFGIPPAEAVLAAGKNSCVQAGGGCPYR